MTKHTGYDFSPKNLSCCLSLKFKTCVRDRKNIMHTKYVIFDVGKKLRTNFVAETRLNYKLTSVFHRPQFLLF